MKQPEPCPPAGAGVNRWMLHRAHWCRIEHFSPQDAERILLDESRGCGRAVKMSEIQRAIRKAYDSSDYTASIPIRKASEWPPRDSKRAAAIIASGGGLADLWEASPIRFEDHDSHTEYLVPQLFPGNPLLCCGRSSYDFDTKPLDAWHGTLADQQFIVPSPMSALTGITQDGKESAHTLSNTGPRRYLICEFDQGTQDEQAALLLHLSNSAPLVLALHSGGKSLHGWFLVEGESEEHVIKFFRYAVRLGADTATKTKSQFVRMPDGRRDNGVQQTVYFFNPAPLKKLIKHA